jgi:hypothetical protein
MFRYSQTTGELSFGGHVVGTCYSGHGEGLNNPEMQEVPQTGPIPQGTYTIGPAFTHATKGPFVMELRPDADTEEYGRSGFLMHGDNQALNESGSEGCIVAARPIRVVVASSTDRQLLVTE